MAAVGPYGIEQFDAPGVVANYQAMQGNRIKMMLEQKQLEQLERASAIQQGTLKALAAYAGSAAPSAPTTPAPQPAPSAAPAGSGMPAAATSAMAAPPQPAPVAPASYVPSDNEMAARKRVLTSLTALNPEMGGQLADAFTKMDANQVAAVTQRHTRIAQIAAGILQLPQPQRQAAIQQAGPELQQMGLSPQQIQGFQPTDANLRQLVAEGMDIDHIAAFSRPDVQSVRQGGALVGTNPDGTPTTLYESPTMVGPNGEVFARPSQLSTMPKPVTATNKQGQQIQYNPQTQKWEPIGGQSQPATGGFQ